ncbi:MAG: DUF5667 domain-containing protein [Anaerolineaceae bacterium]|nr:DUF5667 domain-containing protein [Anaerolineaceae bacterium]
MNSQNKSKRINVLVFVSLIAVLLLGSIGATSVAANSAIPGDALYSWKTTVEQTQLKLSKDAANRAQLKISFAEERLEEISKLVDEGRYLEIQETVLAFESAINGALFELESVSKTDPTQAAQLASEITAALSKYAEVLTNLAASVPEVVRAEVNRALDSALLAGSLDMSSDDNDNDDMNSNDDDDDNMNSNDDDDDDMNSNDDDDDDMNSNDDDDDDDMNSNSDDDDDMNSNDDDDDDMNSNSDDDDDMNSNDDDDDNYNNDDDDDDNDDNNNNDNDDDDDDDDDSNDNEDDDDDD